MDGIIVDLRLALVVSFSLNTIVYINCAFTKHPNKFVYIYTQKHIFTQ